MTDHPDEEIKREIGKLITQIMVMRHPDETPFVMSWAIVLGVTSIELQANDHERSEYISPIEQSVFTTVGLYSIAARDYGAPVDDD